MVEVMDVGDLLKYFYNCILCVAIACILDGRLYL